MFMRRIGCFEGSKAPQAIGVHVQSVQYGDVTLSICLEVHPMWVQAFLDDISLTTF